MWPQAVGVGRLLGKVQQRLPVPTRGHYLGGRWELTVAIGTPTLPWHLWYTETDLAKA